MMIVLLDDLFGGDLWAIGPYYLYFSKRVNNLGLVDCTFNLNFSWTDGLSYQNFRWTFQFFGGLGPPVHC